MLVTIDFEYNGSQYRIERGRRPNVFRLMRDGIDLNESVDEAQGEMRQTQTEVDSYHRYLSCNVQTCCCTKHIHRTVLEHESE